MTLFTITLVLLLIMDPFGNISSYLQLVAPFDKKKQRWILMREMLIVLGIMIGFNYLGEFIFDVLSLSETTVRLSSGVILFLTAIKILFPSTDSVRANLPAGEPYITPLAVPLIAGPSLMATIMLFAHLETCQAMMLEAIFISWAAVGAVLYFATPIKRVLGNNGLMACERLMGMVLVLVSVQRFLEGILIFWQTQQPGG